MPIKNLLFTTKHYKFYEVLKIHNSKHFSLGGNFDHALKVLTSINKNTSLINLNFELSSYLKKDFIVYVNPIIIKKDVLKNISSTIMPKNLLETLDNNAKYKQILTYSIFILKQNQLLLHNTTLKKLVYIMKNNFHHNSWVKKSMSFIKKLNRIWNK